MKKLFLSAIGLLGACSLYAQQIPTSQVTDTTAKATDIKVKTPDSKVKVSDTKYGMPPAEIQTNFQTTYPGMTQVTWQPMNDWWYASYPDNNNRIVNVYYNTQPYYLIRNESFKVMLPVLNTMVPEDVITNAIHTYPNELYSITAMKPDSSGMSYKVTLIKNGTAEVVTMNGTGVAYNKPDQY